MNKDQFNNQSRTLAQKTGILLLDFQLINSKSANVTFKTKGKKYRIEVSQMNAYDILTDNIDRLSHYLPEGVYEEIGVEIGISELRSIIGEVADEVWHENEMLIEIIQSYPDSELEDYILIQELKSVA